jgi:hypothetical protein
MAHHASGGYGLGRLVVGVTAVVVEVGGGPASVSDT